MSVHPRVRSGSGMTALGNPALRQLALRALAERKGSTAGAGALAAAAQRAYEDLTRVSAPLIGDVGVTVKNWLRDSIESPLGFIAFDLDYYSSTKAALALLDGPESTHLPRVHCYFDDLAAGDQSCMNRYVGEYLAIDEFNAAHRDRKICLIEQLRINRQSYEYWQERMYVFHNFSHAKYTQVVVRGARHTEMPL